MKWFKHKTDASERKFMLELEDKFGIVAYARWFKILEKIGKIYEEKEDCSVSLTWTEWQSFLKGKQNKLRTFLEHCENEQRMILEQTGNVLKITIPKFKEIKDNHNKVRTHKKKVSPATLTKSLELELELDKDKTLCSIPTKTVIEQRVKFNSEYYFEIAWKAYPKKFGRKQAVRHYEASVKNGVDHSALMASMANYIKYVDEIRASSHPERQYQNGATWFNNWQDHTEPHKAEVVEDEMQRWLRLQNEKKALEAQVNE